MSKFKYEIVSVTNGETYEFDAPESYMLSENGECLSDYIPLVTFYYEALGLCYYNINNNFADTIFKIQEYLSKIWLSTTPDFFDTLKDEMLSISKQVRNCFNKESSFEEIIYSKEVLEYLEKWEKDPANKKAINRPLNFAERKGCVAIAIPLPEYQKTKDYGYYFSLSGSGKDYIGNSIPGWAYDRDIKKLYKIIGNLFNHIFKAQFIECHLTDNVERYTKFDKVDVRGYETHDGRALTMPIKLIEDYSKKSGHELNTYYSCCERKIVAELMGTNMDYDKILKNIPFLNLLSKYEFRVKYKPCYLCIPSLSGCFYIYYLFNSLEEFVFDRNNPKRVIHTSQKSKPFDLN